MEKKKKIKTEDNFTCKSCKKKFKDFSALQAHNNAKHKDAKDKKPNLKKIKNLGIFVIVVGLIVFGVSSLVMSYSKNRTVIDKSELNFSVPNHYIHWHPHLQITINGKNIVIPEGIGITDNGDMPIHTHDASGEIHMEEDKPTKESVTLGYFFQVWGKKFSKNCIFEYCTDKGNLTMFVNGKRNYDFQNYFMHDGDNITINYDSFKN